MTQAGVLAYWFDIAPEIRAPWLDWYLRDHMPSRVGTTFVAGRCYEAVSAARSHMVLFETDSPDALLAPSYVELLKQVTDEDRRRRGWYANTIRVTCRVPARAGRGIGGALGVIRIAAGGARLPQRLPQSLTADVIPFLQGCRGIGAAWLLENDPSIRQRMDEVRVTGHEDGTADWALLVCGGHDADLADAFDGLRALPAWAALDLGPAVTFDRYRLLYAMTQSDRR